MAIAESKSDIKTPFYYIRKRLLKNYPAMFGLVVIALVHLIAILGYLILPDKTPNCNDGAWTIKKQTPGFEVDMLKMTKSIDIDDVGFFEAMFFGRDNKYTIMPINGYEINGINVIVKPYGRLEKPEEMSLLQMVHPVYAGVSNKIMPDSSSNFKVSNGVVTYLDQNQNIKTVSLKSLEKTFKSEHIEHRTYWLGTDKAGRDMLSRLLFGTRISLGIGFVSVLISLTLGILLGATGGFFGGKVDSFIMWLMTVVWSIPGIMLVIAISLALQSKGIWVAFVAVGLTSWVEIARVVRGQIISIKEKLFVEAARALGIGNQRIIFVHILPNIMGPLIVIATSNFASAILTEAGLSFLGLGVQPPMPSWGIMINEGYHTMGTVDSWHLILFPSLCICITVLAFNLFGNGLRDAYDPQSRTKW
jgi:ABC-type dipeptide/oligopeptide/nickel transport system permease subunit